MKEITNIEIVAAVEATNMIPEGWSEVHPLYRRDPNSWVYLTAEGQKVYEEYKGEVDLLIHTVYEPKLKAWSKEAVKKVLSV
ncbi:hypothetical protein QTG56_23615 (plasmid) [Rossellomorea sp. AcN35-11]|nr:hypothetical protein [Rossellomorea aquimaris]WJV32352.1 hypothetical protein QTG56_23615 [Rossellomorea sp. AcN35-11]